MAMRGDGRELVRGDQRGDSHLSSCLRAAAGCVGPVDREEGCIELEMNSRPRSLRIGFAGLYRNLGRLIEVEAWKLARDFPAETTGSFDKWSTDGELYCAAYRVACGTLYRRVLSTREEAINAYRLPH